ncbi:MAG TPA: hypothetical protein VNV65_07130 [Candidatus Solibacter sp.]|nr:hypothetical protein [Candidatus Solibacter sp.]
MTPEEELEGHQLLDRLNAPNQVRRDGELVELTIIERLRARVELELDAADRASSRMLRQTGDTTPR